MVFAIEPRLASAAFRHSEGLQVIVDSAGLICDANERWRAFSRELHPHPASCDVGTDYFAVCRRAADSGEPAAEEVLAACAATLQDGQPRAVDYACTGVSITGVPGGQYWYRMRVVRIDADHLLLDHTDVSERETALQRESGYRSQAAFQHLILEGIAQPVIATDMLGTITYWNRSADLLFGYSADQALGHPITAITVPETVLAQAEQTLRTLASGRTWTGEFRVRHRDGTRFPVRVRTIPMLDDAGRVIGNVAVYDDLRPAQELAAQQQKLRELEAQLLQRQKMEALGTVAGGVAHEFNNVLAAVMANADVLHDHCATDTDARTALEGIVEAGARAREVVKALLTFSRPQPSDRAPVDAERWLRSAMRMIESTIPHDVTLSAQYEASPVTVHANETQLTQVLLNLAANACHAMRDRRRRELRVRVSLDTRGKDTTLVLEVSDTGMGMDDTVRARVFDPFFTTKPVGEGSGLGLAVVHGVVEAHDGTIHIQSEPEVGTTVQVRLPVCTGAANDTTDRTPLPSNSVRGHVLVVDDERMVLTALTRVLERAGFTVSAFDRPAAALGFLETRATAQEFSGAVVDYSMPDMCGDELARQMTQGGFRAPIILYSGNTSEVGDVSEYFARVVEKPVTGSELVALLSGTLCAA